MVDIAVAIISFSIGTVSGALLLCVLQMRWK